MGTLKKSYKDVRDAGVQYCSKQCQRKDWNRNLQFFTARILKCALVQQLFLTVHVSPFSFTMQISYLADFGGRNTLEATKRALSFMISNDLAQLCNMTGANGKFAFGATPMFDCVFSKFYLFVYNNTILFFCLANQ